MTDRIHIIRALFGTPAADPVPRARDTALALDQLLMPGEIALIAGPSGAGKSTILRHLVRELRARGNRPIVIDPARLPRHAPSPRVIDSLDAPLTTALSLLASCGLADAAALERPVHQLSTGQRWRLSLARGMLRLRARHATLIADEFASMLDPTTARCLCTALSRWVSCRAVRAVCVSHDESLVPWLAPSVIIHQPLGAPASIRTPGREAA